MKPLEISIKKLRLNTPIFTASGTSGSADEFGRLENEESIKKSLGAVVSKGVTLKAKSGNKPPRLIPTNNSGLVNSIGLQNKGAKRFLSEELPLISNYGLPVFVNISANTIDEFGRLAGYLIDTEGGNLIRGIEINVSCPNIKEGGVIFGTNPKAVERVVKAVQRRVEGRVIVVTKLTPNVTDITESAKAAINGGTDVLSMINTLRALVIDIDAKKPLLGNIYGGLSGPAIKPVGLAMVYQCFDKISECKKKKIPIIGIGGISNWKDALEYIMAGATAVGVGTALFDNLNVFGEIKKGLQDYLEEESTTIKALVGKAH